MVFPAISMLKLPVLFMKVESLGMLCLLHSVL